MSVAIPTVFQRRIIAMIAATTVIKMIPVFQIVVELGRWGYFIGKIRIVSLSDALAMVFHV